MTAPPVLSEAAAALCLIGIVITPCAAAGLALINAGLGRSRNAAHAMLSALCVLGIAALVYCAIGFSWQGYPGREAHAFLVGGKPWDWIAAEPFFFRGVSFDNSPVSLAALFGMFAAGLAALIPLGSGADRWKLGAACASAALLAGLVYPLFAHWVWGGGWLSQLGVNYGLGDGFRDAGGSSTIQAVGGLTALAVAWILGPRRGKYTREHMPVAIPGHNAVFVLFGCLLALVGWSGLNCAGAVLFDARVDRAPAVAINTALGAFCASLAAAAITRVRFGKPDASLCANGWVAGLVASSAACAYIRPALAMLIGFVAGALVVFSVEWLEFRLTVDDPGGAVSVHALGGIWGVLAAGLFVQLPGAPGQWLAQLTGIATLLGFILPLAYFLNWLLDRVYAQRVPPQGERQGLDLHELGAGAYPEFMSHNDDLWQR
jgi:Amt family ammonium transporter